MHTKAESNKKLQRSEARLSQEFCNLLQVEEFVETFGEFLRAKKCAETLEFILLVNRIEKEPTLFTSLVPTILTKYILIGGMYELNLANEDRNCILDKYSKWELTLNASTIADVTESLLHLRTLQLLQLHQERYKEFRNGAYWNNFVDKLHQTTQQKKQIDFSFRWMIPTKNWTAKHVSLWLQSMQIEEYSLFEEHEIEGEMLCGIDRADLIRMGITKIGSIKRILRLMQDISK